MTPVSDRAEMLTLIYLQATITAIHAVKIWQKPRTFSTASWGKP
jgi:hypothetical protein